MKQSFNYTLIVLSLLCLGFSLPTHAQESQLEGRWDLVMDFEGKEVPSWLEVKKSGYSTLIGRFVFAFGSARPVAEVKIDGDRFSFSIPKQWEPGDLEQQFEGKLEGQQLTGSMRYTDGNTYNWTGTRAPVLPFTKDIKWGKITDLFNGKDLSGWTPTGENQWEVADGLLKSPKAGSNLVTDDTFTDFKLHAEFRYPEGSNSGIYLRGRYEVQIADNKGDEPSNIKFGGVYGFLTPNEMVAKNAGEWQSYDITLIGQRVTIVANGKAIITDQIIPGITGGALNSREGEPGPIFIQGDHGPIEFRSFTIQKPK